jgi:hypothetical protein
MAWNRDYCVGCLVNGLILGSDQWMWKTAL